MPADIEDEIKDEKNPRPLDEDDIALLKTYVRYPSSFLQSSNLSIYLLYIFIYVGFSSICSYVVNGLTFCTQFLSNFLISRVFSKNWVTMF